MELINEGFGPLWVYELPDPHDKYIVGADTAEGVIRDRRAGHLDTSDRDPDFNAAVVLSERTGIEVARYISNYAPGLYSDDLMALGYFYGTASGCVDDALIVPERNAIGAAVIDDLVEGEYPRVFMQRRFNTVTGAWDKHIGFQTNRGNKDILVKDLQTAIIEGTCGIVDIMTAKHCASMRRNSRGSAEAPAGAHDDLAMALMLAMVGRRELRIESGEEEVDPRPRQSQAERDAEFAARVYGSGDQGDEEEVDPAEDHPW